MAKKPPPPEKPDYRVKILRFILLALVLALGFNLTVSQYGFLNMFELKKQNAELKAEEIKYNTQLVDLEIKKNRLLNDTLYLEKLARTKLQLCRPGETATEY
jgi:cell division protein FtsB